MISTNNLQFKDFGLYQSEHFILIQDGSCEHGILGLSDNAYSYFWFLHSGHTMELAQSKMLME